MVKYNFNDLKQAIIGSFLAIVVLLAIRGGDPFFFNATSGFIISAVILYIYYISFNGTRSRTIHFVIDVAVAFVIASLLSYLFNLITIEEIMSFKVFGSLVAISWWLAIPSALLFDRFNFTNPLDRFFVRGRN